MATRVFGVLFRTKIYLFRCQKHFWDGFYSNIAKSYHSLQALAQVIINDRTFVQKEFVAR